MEKKTINTNAYGQVTLVFRYDSDSNESFYDMYEGTDENGGYFGELHTNEDIDEITCEEVEEQIYENLYY